MSPRFAFAVLALTALTAWSFGAAPASAQESSARLDAPVVIADDFHRFEFLLDLDDDGFADALDWLWTDNSFDEIRVTGWINDQAGTLVPTWDFTIDLGSAVASDPYDTAVGDLNGDDRGDFAISNNGNVWLYTSNGAAAPSLAATINNPADVTSILLADFDGDGFDDLALNDGATDILLNQFPGRGFVLSDSFATAGDGVLLPIEANGDGEPDLMTVSGDRMNLYYVANGALTGQTSILHGLPGAVDKLATAGDVDNDLDQDLVVFGDDGNYAVLRRDGPATFTAEALVAGGPATDLADVNGDGFVDGVCCSSGGSSPNNIFESTFMIAINDGTGGFAPSFTIESLGAEHIAGVADLDADGDADLVAGRVVYYAEGPLTGPRQPVVSTHEDGLLDRLITDCDGDGDPDFAFGLDGALRNLGDNTYEGFVPTAPAAPAGRFWYGPGHAGDFDGDGDVDLVVTESSGTKPCVTMHGMRLLENNGAGALYDGGPATGAGVNMSVAGPCYADDPRDSLVADGDGDGDLDIFIRTLNPTRTKVFWNDGSGFFSAGQQWDGKTIIDVAELNGDAELDLVMADSVTEVYFGQGAHVFSAPTLLLSSFDPHSTRMDVADVDGDGDTDIAAPNWFTKILALHINDGAGNFTTDVTTFASWLTEDQGQPAQRVFVTDLNDDGWDDLVLSPVDQARNSAFVFLKRAGQAGWHDPVVQVVNATAASDVDGDGDQDLLGEWAVTNRQFVQPDAGFRRQYGSGLVDPGLGGLQPVLGASGPFRVGETVRIHVTGAPANTVGLFAVSFQESDLPHTPWLGVNALNWPWLLFFYFPTFGDGTLAGDGRISMPYTVDALTATVGPIHHQVFFADPSAPFNRTASNGLVIEYR